MKWENATTTDTAYVNSGTPTVIDQKSRKNALEKLGRLKTIWEPAISSVRTELQNLNTNLTNQNQQLVIRHLPPNFRRLQRRFVDQQDR